MRGPPRVRVVGVHARPGRRYIRPEVDPESLLVGGEILPARNLRDERVRERDGFDEIHPALRHLRTARTLSTVFPLRGNSAVCVSSRAGNAVRASDGFIVRL